MAALNFNPMEHEPLGDGFTVYPAGWYPVAVKSSEVKSTNDQKNGYLLLNCEILDGAHKGGTIPVRLNLYNESQGARDFANRTLTSICYAVGFYQQLQDSAQIHGAPFQIQLEENEMDYRPGDDRTKPKKKSNDFKAIRDIHGNAPGKPGGAAAGSSGAPSSAPASAPSSGPPAGWTPPAGQPAGDPNAGQPAAGWQPPAAQGQPPANAGGWQPPAQQQGQPPANAGWTPPAAGGSGPPPAAPWGAPAA